MICSNCGKECSVHAGPVDFDGNSIAYSDCCNALINESYKGEWTKGNICPCESESTEDCKACQDIRTVEDVKAGLFALEAVKDAMSKVGIIGYVRDRIIEELVK